MCRDSQGCSMLPLGAQSQVPEAERRTGVTACGHRQQQPLGAERVVAGGRGRRRVTAGVGIPRGRGGAGRGGPCWGRGGAGLRGGSRAAAAAGEASTAAAAGAAADARPSRASATGERGADAAGRAAGGYGAGGSGGAARALQPLGSSRRPAALEGRREGRRAGSQVLGPSAVAAPTSLRALCSPCKLRTASRLRSRPPPSPSATNAQPARYLQPHSHSSRTPHPLLPHSHHQRPQLPAALYSPRGRDDPQCLHARTLRCHLCQRF